MTATATRVRCMVQPSELGRPLPVGLMHSCAARRSSTQLTGTAYVKADCQLYSLPPPPACEAAPYAASFAFRAGPSASGSHALVCRPRIVHPTHRRSIRGDGLSALQPDQPAHHTAARPPAPFRVLRTHVPPAGRPPHDDAADRYIHIYACGRDPPNRDVTRPGGDLAAPTSTALEARGRDRG